MKKDCKNCEKGFKHPNSDIVFCVYFSVYLDGKENKNVECEIFEKTFNEQKED